MLSAWISQAHTITITGIMSQQALLHYYAEAPRGSIDSAHVQSQAAAVAVGRDSLWCLCYRGVARY